MTPDTDRHAIMADVPEVLLTFMDGEVLRCEAPLIDFSTTVLDIVAVEPGGNNREIRVPLTSIKYIIFGGEEEVTDAAGEQLGKVVIHFVDHDVMRAFAGRNTLGGPLGIIYTLIDPNRHVRRQLGVPYSAVKAIFKVKQWDSRGKPQRSGDKVAKILASRELQARADRIGTGGPVKRKTPLLDRTAEGEAKTGKKAKPPL
jgi:hypothetical protein